MYAHTIVRSGWIVCELCVTPLAFLAIRAHRKNVIKKNVVCVCIGNELLLPSGEYKCIKTRARGHYSAKYNQPASQTLKGGWETAWKMRNVCNLLRLEIYSIFVALHKFYAPHNTTIFLYFRLCPVDGCFLLWLVVWNSVY